MSECKIGLEHAYEASCASHDVKFAMERGLPKTCPVADARAAALEEAVRLAEVYAASFRLNHQGASEMATRDVIAGLRHLLDNREGGNG